MEAMAAGMFPVTTDSGALAETLGGVGVAFPKTPTGEFPDFDFVEMVVDGLTDPVIFTTNLLAGRERAASLSWQGVAEEWDSWFSSILSTV
jgi:glycosyltransferase involved in cell wall biosynthesis